MITIFLAYAVFILILAAPLLFVVAVGAGIIGGTILAMRGANRQQPLAIMFGLALLMVSVMAAVTVHYWATTKPGPLVAENSPHRLVYDGYQAIQMRNAGQRAMNDFIRSDTAEKARQADAGKNPAAGDTAAPKEQPR